MRKPEDYNYDVFLSWTGADRPVKNRVKEILIDSGIPEDRIYDSDVRCRGEFRSNFSEALKSSMVYLLILTDNLREVVMDTKEDIPVDDQKIYYSEVRREVSIAADLDAVGELNVVILNFSEFFAYKSPHMDSSDKIGEFFYNYTRGYNMINVYENLADDTDEKAKLVKDVHEFIKNRREGKPVPSSRFNSDVQFYKYESVNIIGREEEIDEIDRAFTTGSKVVVLSGMGGIGKTTIARKYLEKCSDDRRFVCPQIVRLELRDDRERNLYDSFIDAVAYKPEFRNLTEKEKHEQKKGIVQNLPDYYLILIDNINDITDDELKVFLERLNCRLLITARRIGDEDIDSIKSIRVGELSLEKATELIQKESGDNSLTKDDVKPIYDDVAGHTLFLFLIARAMNKHHRHLSQLYAEFAEKGTIGEKVTVLVKDTTQVRDTVSALLERLFDFDNFGEDEVKRAVLANLAVMLDGKLPLKYVKEMLNLDNMNEILELDQTGWVEYSRTDETLSIHKMLANVVNNKLHPRQVDLKAAIKFLVDSSAEYRQDTLSNIAQLSDMLYHTLTMIARNEKKLCDELWQEYEQLSNISDQPVDITRDCERLNQLISEETDKFKIDTHAVIATIQYVPADVVKMFDQIKAMVAKGEYKTAYKFMPTLFAYLRKGALSEDEIDEFLAMIMDKAIANDDEYLAFSIFINAKLGLGNRPKTMAKVKEFLRVTKKDNGAVQYIKLFNHLNTKAYFDLLKNGMIDSKGNISARKTLKMCNYNVFGMLHRMNKMLSLPEDDPLGFVVKKSGLAVSGLFDKGELDVDEFLDGVKKLLLTFEEKDLPHADLNTMITQIGNVFRGASISKLHDYPIDKIALPKVLSIKQRDDAMITVQLSVFTRRNDTALHFMNALLTNAYKSFNSAYTVQYAETLLLCAKACGKLTESQNALKLYLSAYLVLKQIADGSEKLAEASRNILELYLYTSICSREKLNHLIPGENRTIGEILNVDGLKDVFESTKGYSKRFSWEELDNYCNYAKSLRVRYNSANKMICEEHLIKSLREVADNAKAYCKNAGYFALTRYLNGLNFVMTMLPFSNEVFDEVAKTAKVLAKHADWSSKKAAKLINMQAECFKCYKADDKRFLDIQRKSLEVAVRTRSDIVGAITRGIDMTLMVIENEKWDIDSVEKAVDTMRCKPKNRSELVKLVDGSVKRIGEKIDENLRETYGLRFWAKYLRNKAGKIVSDLNLKKIRSVDKLWMELLEKSISTEEQSTQIGIKG